MSPVRAFDADARAQTAQWLELWARNGPVLEARRVEELRALTDESAARLAVEVIWPMAPAEPGDAGAGLTALHEVLRRLAARV